MKKYFVLIVTILAFATSSTAAVKQKDGGDVTFTKPLKSVHFSHKAHVEAKGLTCDMCHNPHSFHMHVLDVQENADFNMKGLVEGKYCGKCHNGIMSFASNTRCTACHTGVKWLGEAKDEKGKHH